MKIFGTILLVHLMITFDLAAAEESKRINAFFEKNHQEDLALSPQFQTWLGIKDDYDKWDDDSLENYLKNIERIKNRLKKLRTFDFKKLDEQAQISYRIAEIKAEQRLEYHKKFRNIGYAISHSWGPHTSLASFLINYHRIDTAKDAESYISRLKGIPKKLQWAVEDIERHVKRGTIPPQFVFPLVEGGAKNVITGKPFDKSKNDSPLWKDIQRKIDELKIDTKKKNELRAAANQALVKDVAPAFKKFIAYMTKLSKRAPAEGGTSTMPKGKAYYAYMLKTHTSTNLSPDYLHNWGLQDVARIHKEMKTIAKKVRFKGSLQDFFKFIKNDPQFKYPNTEEGRKKYLTETKAIIDRLKKRLPEMFNIFPKADFEVRPVEKYREKSAGIAFYTGPAKDGSRPGYYYVNLADMSAVSKTEMEALAYHEAIPGHHMQIAIAMELEGIPNFRKFGGFTSYSEGWGLYTELLPKEFGFYKDPYSDFGRLSMELWRACRLVVDTGIHAKGWTQKQAIKYLEDNTPSADSDNVKAIRRYTMWPGQATAYKVGMQKILDLRKNAKDRLKTKFDIREFHDEILKTGAIPLKILEERIDRWVQRKSADK